MLDNNSSDGKNNDELEKERYSLTFNEENLTVNSKVFNLNGTYQPTT